MANDSNFDRNPLRGCNYGLEGGCIFDFRGCSSPFRGCSLMHNIKELQISIFSASNAIIFPFWCPTLCWNRRTLSAQFRFQNLSASFSYSGWYVQGLPRSPCFAFMRQPSLSLQCSRRDRALRTCRSLRIDPPPQRRSSRGAP